MGQPDGIRSCRAAGKASTFDLVPRVCGVVRPPPKVHSPALDRVSEVRANSFSAPPIVIGELRASAAEKERSKQITCKSSAAYYSQFTWVSSWPASLGGLSRNIATTTLKQLLATLDIWTQSGTGVSRKPSESVFCGWFYDVREERRPGTDPQKSVTGFRFGGRGRGRPENIVKKPV